jgi:hypothetical protein
MSLYSKQILVMAIVPFMLSLFLCPASLLSEEEKTKEQIKKDAKEISVEYAALQAAKQVINKWENRDIPGIVKECIELNFKKENKKRNDCKANLKKYFTEKVSKEIDNDFETVARSFKGEKGRNSLFNEIKERFKNDISTSIETNVNKKYPAVFKDARTTAIGRQLQNLTINIYPEEDTPNIKKFESAYLKDWPPIDVKKLESDLKEKIEKKEELLEEVEKLKEKIISEVLEDIKQQMKTQVAAASEELPAALKTRNQLKNAMIRNIRTVIGDLKSKGGKEIVLTVTDNGEEIRISKVIERKVYGIFEFVMEDVKNRAIKMEKARFCDFCRTTDAIQTWNETDIKHIITQDLAAHKKYTKSKGIIFNSYFPRATDAIVESYKTYIPQPERSAVRFHLEPYLKEMEDEIKNRVETLLRKDLDEVRDQIAEAQLKDFFPKLANNSWEVPRLAGEKDESRVDIMKKVNISEKNRLPIEHPSICFQSPIFEEIKSGSINTARLLDNTETKVFQKVQSLINKEAGNAWDEQRRIYEEQKKLVSDKEAVSQLLKQHPFEKEAEISKERLVSYFRKRIREIWRVKRPNTIGYGTQKYSDLFEYFEKEIDKILDQDEGTRLLEDIKIEIKKIKIKNQQKREAVGGIEEKKGSVSDMGKKKEGIGNGKGPNGGKSEKDGLKKKSLGKKKAAKKKPKCPFPYLLCLLCLLAGVILGLFICYFIN